MILRHLLKNKSRTSRDDTGPRFVQVPRREAGIYIDHDTALQFSAVFACIRVISEDIAGLPWHVLVRKTDKVKELVSNHPAYAVLNRRPNPEMSPFDFKQTIVAHALTWGNGYAEIVRDLAGRVVELWPLPPDRVEVKRDEEGILVYEIANSMGPKTYLQPRDVYHIHGMGYDGVTGYSVVSYARRTIGMGQAAEQFGASFFANGARLSGVIEIPQDSRLGDTAKQNMRDTFNNRNQGPYNAGNTEVLDGGAKYTKLGIPPEDAQYLETRQFQVEEVCRWFRVAPQKVAHLLRMTFNNVEQLSIDHVNDSLMPWVKRMEEEADYKIFGATNTRFYTKINVNGLLRGDSEARTKYYRELSNLAALSPNEIRELEDMNPIPDGDKYVMQSAMTTLEKIGEDPEPVAFGNRFDEQGTDKDENLNAYKVLLQDRIYKFLENEHKRFDDLKTRYTDRQDYVERVSGFLGGQKIKVSKAVEKHLSGALIALGVDESQVSDAADVYAKLHVDCSRSQALSVFDNGATMDRLARAQSAADKLINTVSIYAKRTLAHV